VASATVREVEELNILNAAMLAMKRAYKQLAQLSVPDFILIDGNKSPEFSAPHPTLHTVVSGDEKSASIAAASIIAKVTRDRYMSELDELYPEYGFAAHKGYGTKLHREMLLEYGASPVHRNSFLKKLMSTPPKGEIL
jgi:ribonuclease HII